MATTERLSTIRLERPAWPSPALEDDLSPLPPALLEAESRFYGSYAWCLDIFPTMRELKQRLGHELARPPQDLEGWPRQEVPANVFLLSCALADATDDYLVGESYDFSRAAVLPGIGRLTRVVDRLLQARAGYRARRQGGLRRWRGAWGSALVEFLEAWMAEGNPDPARLASAKATLAGLL